MVDTRWRRVGGGGGDRHYREICHRRPNKSTLVRLSSSLSSSSCSLCFTTSLNPRHLRPTPIIIQTAAVSVAVPASRSIARTYHETWRQSRHYPTSFWWPSSRNSVSVISRLWAVSISDSPLFCSKDACFTVSECSRDSASVSLVRQTHCPSSICPNLG